MAKFFMPEATAEERLRVLRDTADKMEETSYERELSPDELDSKREKFVDNSIKISSLEDELNEKKTEFKNKIEPVKLENKTLQYEVKTKKTKVKGTLFHLANHEDGMMETYDHSGEMIGSRRLRPDERQARLYIPPKAVGE